MIQAIRCMLGMHTWERALYVSQVPDAGMYCVHCMYVDWLVDELDSADWDTCEGAPMHVPCTCYVNTWVSEERTWDWYIDKEIGTWDEYARESPIHPADMCAHDRRGARVEYALIV
mgnify:FL=1